MEIFKILSVIMGILMVSLCAVYVRTKKVGHNNLFSMLMLSVGAVVLTTLAIIYPSWWMVGILSYSTFGMLWYQAESFSKLRDSLPRWYRNKTEWLRNASSWACVLILLAISVTMLIKYWAWYVGVVFIPLATISVTMTLYGLHSVLKKI